MKYLFRVFTVALILPLAGIAQDPAEVVPGQAPRTWILDGREDAFRQYNEAGKGAGYLKQIREDFDAYWLNWPFPEEPEPYGDPDPEKRTGDKVDKWRAMQDLCGQVSGVAEAATLLWLNTGDPKYLAKAREFLLSAVQWDPRGPTGINYNDEAHFRLFRKLPAVYDQLRPALTDPERDLVIEHFRLRGVLNMESILDKEVDTLSRNSVKKEPPSHSVRFMAMTGMAALAFWDEIPEARDWWKFVYTWYRDVFPPWGGDDGGWAEGPAYWRGVYEHAVFQDALFAIGDPLAYNQPFWRQTGFFQVYFVQPYPATSFGDLSNAGQFNMEPGVKHFLEHLARVTDNGYLAAYTRLYSDPRPLPVETGMKNLYRVYPTACEYWIRDFIGSRAELPHPKPLAELPGARYFSDIGWVAMHSALGRPLEDIMLTFKSSPYGSFSHSHADQNAFILNAYGEQLAINSGYREYHRSQMHKYYTRHTESKNAILINRRGQEVQDKSAKGRIIRYETGPRTVWTTGDATVAYNTMQPGGDAVEAALRDVVFIDNRYFVIRDHVRLEKPGRIDWLLHARDPITYHEVGGSVVIARNGAYLFSRLCAYNNELEMKSWTGFPIEVDPKYKDLGFIRSQVYVREPAVDQAHFQANTRYDREEQVIFAVLWPSTREADQDGLSVELLDRDTVRITRPDGRIDEVRLTDSDLSLTSP